VSTLQLHIEGPERTIAFESFVGLLNRSLLILKDTDRAVSAKASGVLDWVVADLSSDNGLDAVIESKPRKRAVVSDRDVQRITSAYVDALAIAEQGEALPPHLSETALTQLQWMATQLQRNGAEALSTTYVELDQRARVSADTADNVKRLRVPKSRAIGSIIGLLEVVSVHGPPRYSVYDAVTRRPVRCQFKPGEIDQVKGALGSRVMVAGIIRRNVKGQPLSVEQPRLSAMPRSEDLPSTDELIGLDPDFTGSVSTDEYVRRLRDG
jgi:hypothetical protein